MFALVPTTYVNPPPEEPQSTINATTISSNINTINDLQDQIDQERNQRITKDLNQNLTFASMQAEIDNLTNLVNQQQTQINDLIIAVNTLAGNP
jgi:hypothetical protein